MNTKSFEEIEDYVLNYIENCSPQQIVELYEAISKEKVEVEDWQN